MVFLVQLVLFASISSTIAAVGTFPKPSRDLSAKLGPVDVPVKRQHTVTDVNNVPGIVAAVRAKYNHIFKEKLHTEKRDSLSGCFDEAIFPNIGTLLGYTAQMSIGTPPQELNVILDTSLAYIWLLTSDRSNCPSSTPQFNIPKLSSYVLDTGPSSEYFQQFGNGAHMQGNTSFETITLQGSTAEKQAFLAISGFSGTYPNNGTYPYNESISGVFGLGPSLLTLDATKSFVDNAASQWSQPLTGIYFGPNPGQPNENTAAPGGVLTTGGTNSQYYKGDIEYKDVYGDGEQESWLLPLTAITVQGKSISIPSFSVSASDGLAAIDTGSTLIGVPEAVAQNIWAAVPGSQPLSGNFTGMYSFPCEANVDVSFAFGGSSWAISPRDIAVSDIAAPGITSSQTCLGAIYSLGNGTTNYLLGDTFLRNVYTVLRVNSPYSFSVGFAQLANGSPDTGSGSGSGGGKFPSAAVGSPMTSAVVYASVILPASISLFS